MGHLPLNSLRLWPSGKCILGQVGVTFIVPKSTETGRGNHKVRGGGGEREVEPPCFSHLCQLFEESQKESMQNPCQQYFLV